MQTACWNNPPPFKKLANIAISEAKTKLRATMKYTPRQWCVLNRVVQIQQLYVRKELYL